MFISIAYVVLDPGQQHITLSRAGHDAPLLYRAADERAENQPAGHGPRH